MSDIEIDNQASRKAIFRNRNFRVLFIGSTISNFGDQFYMVALPWLILLITGDSALALGSIMAAAGVPRAIFMVLGGAVTDRISPKVILLASATSRAVLVGLLAGLILLGVVQLWMLFVLALCFGFADAFATPAGAALLPRLVDDKQLAPANALFQGAFQVSGIVGPAAAGLLIAFFGDDASEGGANLFGIGIAFLIDATTFIAVVMSLYFLRLPKVKSSQKISGGIFASILQGIRFVFSRPGYRALFILTAVTSTLVAGPTAVGMPYLVKTEFPGGSASFGFIISIFAAGSLTGAIFGGALPRPKPRLFGSAVLLSSVVTGLGFIGISLSPNVTWAAPFTFISAAGMGYSNILMMTWFQSRTPLSILGRVMGLIMTAATGLAPISMAVVGALIVFDVRLVMVTCASLYVTVALLAFLSRSLRLIGLIEKEDS